MATLLTRKPGQILSAKYGHIWPLNLHSQGFCLVINPQESRYVWADNRKTLESVSLTLSRESAILDK